MFAEPKNSPWGQVDYCDTLCPGVFLVYTPDHGGTMVAKAIEEFLSPAARKQGQRQNGFLCYEGNTAEAIVFRELLDKRLWDIPDRIKNRTAFEENIASLAGALPGILRSREQGARERADYEARALP